MAKRKLSPFTVDDASDAFVPSVKEYVVSEPDDVEAPKKKKSSGKKASPAKTPAKKKQPKSPKKSEKQPEKQEEKTVSVPASTISQPTQPEIPKIEETPPAVPVSPPPKEEPVIVSTPAPQKPPRPIQIIEETAAVSDRFIEDAEEEGFQDMAQFVGFKLDEEAFGIDILLVREIIRILDITPVPETDEYVEGVINLRGKVIPIINLRARLDLKEWEEDKDTRIIIIEHDARMIGFIVDRVSEVIRIPRDTIEPPPSIVAGIESEYLDGVTQVEDQLIVLLNITKLLAKQLQKVNA